MIDLKDLYWLAGIIEGEGSFSIKGRNRDNLSVKVKMTDEDIVRRCHAVAGVGNVSGPHTTIGPTGTAFRKDGEPYAQTWAWVVGRQVDASALMMTLYPLMGQRRQARIRELLDMWSQRPITQTWKTGWKGSGR